jgi:hypothetical protein
MSSRVLFDARIGYRDLVAAPEILTVCGARLPQRRKTMVIVSGDYGTSRRTLHQPDGKIRSSSRPERSPT